MILTLKNKSFRLIFFAILVGLFFVPVFCMAQSGTSQTISVSPTLFDMQATPGQTWSSELRVVNVNNYDMVVYPQVVNFSPLDETGRVDLIFETNDTAPGSTLAEWVTVALEPIVVPEQQTVTIPFSVTAPADAAPGGHYAAILVGTRPPVSDGGVSQVQTAQFVTSLLFVRIDGDIIERGNIREFRTEQSIISTPQATLELRFENTGNVYLQPQGDITIYNMWGTLRGTIPINHQTHYGRVVQNSIREFIFSWKGESNFMDIGRYKAVATLGYGEESKQFTSSITYFWIIPYKHITAALVILLTIGLFLGWVVRMYIRHMLTLAGIDPRSTKRKLQSRPQTLLLSQTEEGMQSPRVKLLAPLTQGVLDIRTKLLTQSKTIERLRAVGQIILLYRYFFIALVGIVTIIGFIIWYAVMVSDSAAEYEVTIESPGSPTTVSSEEIYYQAQKSKDLNTSTSNTTIEQPFSIEIINRSGTLGVAAHLRLELEEKGYTVQAVKTEIGASTNRTVIVFHPDLQSHALALSQTLSGALLSASDSQSPETITIFAGTDISS